MAYVTLTQMTANMLDPVRGWWDERQLSRVCPVSGDADKIVAGMVGYLNEYNQFVAGGGTEGGKNKMPLFARGGARDNDAVRVEGNMASQRASRTQGTPAKVGNPGSPMLSDVGISCLVGTGAYELGTTAFVNGVAAGDLLMADANSNFVDTKGVSGKGKVAKWESSSDPSLGYGAAAVANAKTQNLNQVIGIATSGSDVKNQYGVNMLYFYVNWWPAI